MSEQNKHVYLGDAVYLEIIPNYGIALRTSHHEDGLCDNKIYLEHSVLKNLLIALEKV